MGIPAPTELPRPILNNGRGANSPKRTNPARSATSAAKEELHATPRFARRALGRRVAHAAGIRALLAAYYHARSRARRAAQAQSREGARHRHRGARFTTGALPRGGRRWHAWARRF